MADDLRGIVDRVGGEVKTLAPGDKVVVSFQTACGTCKWCQQKLSSMCDRTNNSSLMSSMYGQRDAGEYPGFVEFGMWLSLTHSQGSLATVTCEAPELPRNLYGKRVNELRHAQDRRSSRWTV